MHINIDAMLVYGAFSGVQHAILHQIRGLLNLAGAHTFTVTALEDVPIETHIGETRQPYTVLRAPVKAGERWRRILWEQRELPAALTRVKTDVLYAPGYLTSLGWRGPSVVFVHDTIALSHPRLCTFSNALNYRLLLPPSARHATLVATPSQASADDVVRYCGVPASRLRVAPLGVAVPPPPTPADIAAARARLGLPGPFLLAVSTIEPKKNFGNLIRWYGAWRRAGIPHALVIIGKWGWGCGEVRRALRQSAFRADIHLPGYVAQEDLSAITAAADLLLMPSRYEGFGLPVLEAMAVGTPVVASDRGALPETVGDAGVVLPLEDCYWQAEIPALLNYPQRLDTLRAAGHARAAAMTWTRTAEHILAALEEARVLENA